MQARNGLRPLMAASDEAVSFLGLGPFAESILRRS